MGGDVLLRRSPRRRNFRDWSGKTVNHLRVLREAGVDPATGLVVWECVCDYKNCGNVCLVSSDALNRGRQTCGCLVAENAIRRNMRFYTEG